MKLIVTALVVAALLAAITTELYDRLLDGNTLGLLALTFVACLISALSAARLSTRDAATSSAGRRGPRRSSSRSRARAEPSGPRETGTVKWFNRSKGFGFIIREDGDEIFVHHRSISSDGSRRASLRDGERVSFTVVKRSKGWQAEDVSPLGA